jgi:hypothetical protein
MPWHASDAIPGHLSHQRSLSMEEMVHITTGKMGMRAELNNSNPDLYTPDP